MVEKIDFKTKANQVYSMPSLTVKLKDRLELVNNILDQDTYFVDYISDNYSGHVVGTGEIATDNKTFKLLERMADYILASEEGKELNKVDKENIAFANEYLMSKIRRESFTAPTASEPDFVKHETVSYKPYKDKTLLSTQEINEKDFEDENLKDIIGDYMELFDKVDSVERFTKRHKDNLKHEIVSDMLTAKNSINNTPKKRNQDYRLRVLHNNNDKYDFLDFTDRKTVIEMLSTTADQTTQYNLYLATLDFKRLIDRAGLTDEELNLYNLLQQGWTYAQMERELGLDNVHIRKVVRKNLVNKIINLGETYDQQDLKSYIFRHDD